MTRSLSLAVCAALLLPLTAAGRAAAQDRFPLDPGDRVVVIGNTFAERMALSGYFDALAHAAHPGHELRIRHVPWSADEVGLRPREKNVPTMEDLLVELDATVVVMCFGMSESFAGEPGVADFERLLGELIDAVRAASGDDASPRRLVLVSPIGHEDLGVPMPTAASVAERNRVLRLYADAMRRVATATGVRYVDLLAPSATLYDESSATLTSDGIHPNETGCFHFAAEIGRRLGWLRDGVVATGSVAAERLRWLAYDSHYHFRLLYRATNSEYVWGRRAEPFGVVNFPPEIEQLERMIEARERAIWAMSLPSPAAVFASPPRGPAIWERVPSSRDFPEDRWSPPAVEAKGTETSLGDVHILDPDAFVASFTLAPGYVIECFASEQDFAELASPLALTFDARGRMWVLCARTYPHLLPGESPRCALLILEDTDGDGRADRRTVFADDLYVPTGFAIDGDGVYIGQAPDLWKLIDTDGDDHADRREIVASGFGMPDSHHTISAFEWEPNGGFVMHEGVFTKSNVETPYGTLRTRDAAVWRFDPRTRRLQLLSHCSFANPWGHVFDDYGQSVLADASGGDNYSFSHVITAFDYPAKPKRVGRLLNRGRPTAGCELIASRHFPDDMQETFLVNQSIGFHGTRWDRIVADGSAWRAESLPQDMLQSSDTNFRPVAMEIGPDGALYIVDWCNPLIGHMQYSVRDPRRDSQHGRVWRIRHADRPLLTPPSIVTASVPELLELLRLPERNTRQHARRRLQNAAPTDVFPELTSWLATVDPGDPLHDRLVLESLWLHQAHGRTDLALLDRVSTLDEPRARAGAVRVLRHWLQQGLVDPDDALAILERAVDDEDMRVRLEGVVACGFIPDIAGGSVASLAAERPMDDGLRIALEETLAYLARYGEPTSGIARRLRLERTAAGVLASASMDEMVAEVTLVRADVPEPRRLHALSFLAGDDGAERVRRLVVALTESRRRDEAARAIAPLLLDMPAGDLAAAEPDLLRAATDDDDHVRSLATAALLGAGRDHEMLMDGDDALTVDVLGHLEPGAAPDELVVSLRDAVEAARVEPGPALEQVARHSGDQAELMTWLVELVDRVESKGLDDFDSAHGTAMAALQAANRLPAEQWPDGHDRYRIEPVSTEHMEAGRAVYFDEINGCARCHGVTGRGEEGFPPLGGSPWVLGNPERAAGIVVHGLAGKISFDDGRTFESAMEPLGANLTDEQIAAALTFVRQSWGNYASPVTATVVARARRLRPPTGTWDVAAISRRYPLHRDRILPVLATTRTSVESGMSFRTFAMALGMQLGPIVLLLLILALTYRLGRRSGST